MPTRTVTLCLLTLCVSVPARSQFTQYTAPGSRLRTPESLADSVQRAAGEARWRLGPLRLDPRVSLTNVGYDENAFSSPDESTRVNDSHATIGAGIVGYLPLGSKSVFSAFLTPEYSWWQDSDDLRQFNLNSGLAWFGNFNRLRLAANASSTERERPLSNELEAPVQIAQDSLALALAIRMTGRLAIFGESRSIKAEHDRDAEQFVPELDLRSLDRDSSQQSYGLELAGSRVVLGIGYRTTEVDFLVEKNRSNDGSGPMARFAYQTGRAQMNVEWANLSIDYDDPLLGDAEQSIGTANLIYKLRAATTVALRAQESLSFAVSSPTGIVESRFAGVALNHDFSSRFSAGVFADNGTSTFVEPESSEREDDLEALGLTAALKLSNNFTLTGRFTEETWDSNQPQFDRSNTRLGLRIELHEELLPW